MNELHQKKCLPCEGKTTALSAAATQELLTKLNGWKLNDTHQQLVKEFKFANFYETMAFVNAVAWIANQENHHPDLAVGYNYCRINYFTHAVKGLTESDFICAAKIDRLT